MAASRQNETYKACVLSAGDHVGHLTLVSDTGKRKNGYVVWKCTCDCGGEIEVDSRTLKRGTVTDCGCIKPVRGRFKNITGQKFGMLTALYPTGEIKPNQGRIWHCRCDCGGEADVASQQLVSGNCISCGCRSRIAKKDLTGQRFGRLTVIEYAGKKNNVNQWKCLCDCGRETTVAQSRLICGTTTSCGCAQKEVARKNMRYIEGTSIVALENAQKHLSSRNTSGHTGVTFNKASGKWVARITFKGITHNLGSFADKNDAIAAREAAESLHSDFLDAYYAKQQVPEDQLSHSNLVITARSGPKRAGHKHTSRTSQHYRVLSPCLMKGPDHENIDHLKALRSTSVLHCGMRGADGNSAGREPDFTRSGR